MKKVRGTGPGGLLSGMNARRNRIVIAKKILVALAGTVGALSMVACQVPDPEAGDRRIVETYTAPAAEFAGRYGSESHQQYKVFTPAGWSHGDRRTLIVFSHGGAWSFGTADEVESVIMDQVSVGHVVLSIEYELEVPAFEQTADIVTAVRWAQANYGRLGIDPTNTFLSGHSAGAHLSLLTAVAPSDLRGGDFWFPVVGVIAVAGPYGVNLADYAPSFVGIEVQDILANVNDCADVRCTRSELDAISPITYIDAADPAVYMVAGGDDDLAPVSHALAVEAAYQSVGQDQRAWVDVVEGAGHQPGFGANAEYIQKFIGEVSASV